VVPVALATGADASAPATSAYSTALELLNSLTAPLVLNLPGITTATTVDAALDYANERGDTWVVIDSAAGDSSSDVLTRAATYSTTNPSYGGVYWPRVIIADPSKPASSSAVLTVGAGAAVLGQIILNDTNSGPQKAPAGYGTQLALVVGLESTPSSADLTACQQTVPAVNPLRAIPGNGVCIFGARTLQVNGQDDKYVNVRRSLIYIESNLENQVQFALFEDNDQNLWAEIAAAVSSWLTTFWQGGGLKGNTIDEAFFVVCDSTNNTDLTVDSGETHCQVGVALQKPAEYIIFDISQFAGSTTTTESAAA